jgi:hypothetical protein
VKKILTCCLITLASSFISNRTSAQSNWEAGVRFGDGFALDATIPLNTEPRLHAAAYFGNNFGLGAYFNWMFALNEGPQGLKFYPGVGPELYFGNEFNIAAAGDFGAEYSFDFPLTVGIDWRPRFMITDGFDFQGSNWGLCARFRFGEGVSFKRVNK